MPRIHLARIASHAEKVPRLIEWLTSRHVASDADVQAAILEAVAEYAPAAPVVAGAG